MTVDTHSQSQPRTTPLGAAFYLVSALLLLVLAYTTFGMELEPFWVLFAIPVALLLPIVVLKGPVFLMVAMVYVGTFKTRRTVAITLTDPTLVTAALLYLSLVLQALLVGIDEGRRGLRDLFAGQKSGVTAFCLLILVIAISYSYTPAPSVGGEKLMKLVLFDTPIFLAPLILLRTHRDVRQLVLLSILVSLCLACRTVFRVMHPSAETLLGEQDPTEIGEGLLMGAAALVALYYPFKEKGFFHLALVGCIVALTCGTMASLSRSAILLLLLVATASLILLRRYPMALSRGAILTTVAAVVVAVSAATLWLWHQPATHSKFALKASELSLALQGIHPPSGTAGQRYSFSESAWQAFLAKPMLGWGAGGWSTLWHYRDERVLKYPHNFVLEIAAEQGLAGLVPLALLLLAMLSACSKILRGKGRQFVFIVPVIALSLLGNAVTGQVEARDMWFWCGTLFALGRMASGSHHLQPSELSV
jgi:O-antigen ligase